jgi:thymidylate kinase
MKNHIICVTGQDRIGKETQSKLLARALPATRFSSPDYDHWSGQIIKAVLQEKAFEIHVDMAPAPPPLHRQTKHPEIFQGLQSINMQARQDLIKAALSSGHVIMDRYEVDALAYGLIDGCDMRYLLELNSLVVPSDYAIILVGKPFPRPGEEPDINERDPVFQRKVRDAYLGYALTHQDTTTVIDVDEHLVPDVLNCVTRIHRMICQIIQDKLDIQAIPLAEAEIAEIFPHLDRKNWNWDRS